MNFKALASAYDSSESESDEKQATDQTVGQASTTTENAKRGKSPQSDEADNGPKDKLVQPSTQSVFSLDAGSASSLPPPPIALLGTNEHARRLDGCLRSPDTDSQPASKRRKTEGQVKTVRHDVFLPRQVQTQIPNVSTEDLQSYGMKPYLKNEPR